MKFLNYSESRWLTVEQKLQMFHIDSWMIPNLMFENYVAAFLLSWKENFIDAQLSDLERIAQCADLFSLADGV